jgi:GNAT superfamily N-acetyltransferase
MEDKAIETTSDKTVSPPEAPTIDGLTFRHFRGDEDYPGILHVNNASKIADGLEHDLHTLETIKHTYESSPNHDPYKDVLIAEINGEMVAYNRVFCERQLEGDRVYLHFGFVLPEWRSKGIGHAMIHWAEDRAREVDAGGQREGTSYISSVVYSSMAGLENLLKGEGYEPVRYEFHMRTPDLDHIPDVPMPEGLEVRPVKPEQYRAIFDANQEAFRDHWGATENEEGDFESWMSHPLNQPDLWVVAWDGDQVAGSILNYVNHEYNRISGSKLGYTEAISVRRPWRRRGLARAMLARSMQLHKELGMTQTGLGVDTQNPSGALQLYESMGYQVIDTQTVYRKRL